MIRKIVAIKVISWKITEEHRWFLNPSFTINRMKFLVNKKLSKNYPHSFIFKFLNTNLLKKSNFKNVIFFFPTIQGSSIFQLLSIRIPFFFHWSNQICNNLPSYATPIAYHFVIERNFRSKRNFPDRCKSECFCF